MARRHEVQNSTRTYEEMLQEQAAELNSMRGQAGSPSYREIERRAAALFTDEKVSLPPSTLSGLFSGDYTGRDRLLWLVRTLMSWDRYGQECEPPTNGATELDEWHDRWVAITRARPPRQRARGGDGGAVRLRQQLEPQRVERAKTLAQRALARILEEDLSLALPALLAGASVFAVAFSPDGELLATGGSRGKVQLWNAVTRLPVGGPFPGHQGRIYCVAFSHDGSLIATGGTDKTVRLWDTFTRQSASEPLGHPDEVKGLAFSHDGTLLATSSDDGIVRLWDTVTHQPVGRPLTGHQGAVLNVAFSHDDTLIATGSADGTARLWDTTTRQPVGEPLTGHQGGVWAVAFSADDNLLATGTAQVEACGTVRLWNLATHELVGEPFGSDDQVWAVAFSPDNTLLATTSATGTVQLWDSVTRRPAARPLTGHHGDVNGVVFAPDGSLLATGSQDGTVRLWTTPAARGTTL
ncbi:WD40 repeat domain-containing protein [Streptomyces microflavus]|uniref:WD40 repeat domain-containing protein n=1 Tax=Streptomyces microflavus TaxID=1919 RepID=UPI00381FAA40